MAADQLASTVLALSLFQNWFSLDIVYYTIKHLIICKSAVNVVNCSGGRSKSVTPRYINTLNSSINSPLEHCRCL